MKYHMLSHWSFAATWQGKQTDTETDTWTYRHCDLETKPIKKVVE